MARLNDVVDGDKVEASPARRRAVRPSSRAKMAVTGRGEAQPGGDDAGFGQRRRATSDLGSDAALGTAARQARPRTGMSGRAHVEDDTVMGGSRVGEWC
jgi:hypothetical protein